MLLISTLAAAADLTVQLAINATSRELTFADAGVGPLPSIILTDAAGEARFDMTLDAFDLDHIAVTYTITRPGKKPLVVSKGTIEGGGDKIPLTFGESPENTFRIAAYAAPVGGTVDRGPLAGCQWQRQLGKTDLFCAEAQLRHFRVDTVSMDEVEAGLARARSNPAIANITGAYVPASVAGKPTKIFEVVITPVVGDPRVSVLAWLGADEHDQLRCEATDTATCLRYFAPFVSGLPKELQ